MKKSFLLLCSVALLLFSSCSDNDDPIDIVDGISIETPNSERIKEASVGLPLNFELKNPDGVEIEKYTWAVSSGSKVERVSTFEEEIINNSSTMEFTPINIGMHQVSVDCLLKNGENRKFIFPEFYVYGKYKFGTFVLNEGNMTSENGSLIFIDKDGNIFDDVYKEENGIDLGNVAQDLFISDNKMYIVTQNGRNDGFISVANAETMKRIDSYTSLPLSWSSHIAVINDSVFVRDNKGVHRISPITKSAVLIKGTKGAEKTRMAVIEDKLYVAAKKNVLIIDNKSDSIVGNIEFPFNVHAVSKSSDNKLFVSITGNQIASVARAAKIVKVNPSDNRIIQENELALDGAPFQRNVNLSAKADTLYFQGVGTSLLRHVFTANETVEMCKIMEYADDAGMYYNAPAVHPVTGEVFANTIKGYGMAYQINNITALDFSKKTADGKYVARNYKDYTRFPAGIYFSANY